VISWIELALALLKIANAIIGQINRDKWVQAGRDEEIAKVTQAILAKTQAGKAIMDRINALSDADVDAQLRRLEPK
jgi:mannose/fructose-specific phosphotransferase system component IIA